MSKPLADVGRKAGTILVVLSMFAFAFSVFLTENARAADDDEYLWGMIFDSDGLLLSYDTDFRVWVEHNGVWKGFPSNITWDPVGTMGGFYSYTLPWDQKEINWSDADQYRIQIDCTPSGGMAENATSNGTGSLDDPVSPRGSYNNEINWLTGGGINNSQQWDVMCSNVDLIPTGIELNGQPYSPPMAVTPFTTVTFSAFVTNVGKTDIAEPNTIVLRNQSGVLGQDTAIYVNSSTSVGPYIFTWNAPASGYFCFNITVDFNDNVTETNENNNSEMVCFSVGEADLTPTGVGITTNYGPQFYLDVSATNYRSNPIPMTPGTTALIVTNVTNVGTLASVASDLAFINTTGIIPFYIPMISPLNPGVDDGPFSVSWVAPATPGNYSVNITADFNNDVVEISELNNTFTLRFLVGYPDYIPWNPALPLVQDVTSATSVPIDAFVSNVDLLNALMDSTIAFYNQTDRMNPFATDTVVPVDAGQTSAVPYSATWIAPIVASMTTFFVVIEVDYDGDIAESNELNNTLVIQFNVFPGPVTTLTYGDPNYVNETATLYINSSTPLDFTRTSSAAWAHTHYSLDGGASQNYSLTGTFTISSEGLHDLTFYSVDSLSNVETTHSSEIVVDNSPPLTSLNVTEPKYIDPLTGNVWVRSFEPATPIYLEWERDDEPDLAVGRELTSFRVYFPEWGTWSSWTDYVQGNPLDLGPTDGPVPIEWYSLDLLGNIEATRTATLYVDNSPPDTSSVIGQPNFEREDTIFVETKTEFTLSANDGSGCGVNQIRYRLDTDQIWINYTGPFKIDKFGEHTIHYRAVDNLGNRFDDSQDVFVIGTNWKPTVAIIFIIIMIIVGAAVGYKRPLIMVRKKQREHEEALLKKEEEAELDSEPEEEEYEEYLEEPLDEVEEYEEVEEVAEEPPEEVEELEEEVAEEEETGADGIIDLSDRRVV